MNSVSTDSPPVNDPAAMKSELRHHVALERVAQTLADATRARTGLPTGRLATLTPREALWYRAIAKALIEIYRAIAEGREPVCESERRQATQLFAIGILRSRGRCDATRLGHDLDVWRPVPGRTDQETTVCRRCHGLATIDLSAQPELGGPALTESCR